MRVFSGPTLASETAATTFTLAGKAFTASVAGPSKMSVSVVMASRSIFCCSIHGAPASPRGGLRVSMVTEVMLASRAPFMPSSPATAPEGTRMRQPCFSASCAHSSRTPTRPPTERTMRCLPAARTEGGLGRRLEDQVRLADERVEREGAIAAGLGGIAHGDAGQRDSGDAPGDGVRHMPADDPHPDDADLDHDVSSWPGG